MPARQSQVIEDTEFIDVSEYDFTGNNETVGKKRAVINAYRLKASIYHAAQAGRVARVTIYRWLESDPAFAQAMEDSAEDSADVMESSVYERALGRNGDKADSLLSMFWLKAKRPAFRDKVAVDVTVVAQELEQRIQQIAQSKMPLLLPAVIDRNGNGHNQSIDSSSITADSPHVQATQKADPVTAPVATSDDQPQP